MSMNNSNSSNSNSPIENHQKTVNDKNNESFGDDKILIKVSSKRQTGGRKKRSQSMRNVRSMDSPRTRSPKKSRGYRRKRSPYSTKRYRKSRSPISSRNSRSFGRSRSSNNERSRTFDNRMKVCLRYVGTIRNRMGFKKRPPIDEETFYCLSDAGLEIENIFLQFLDHHLLVDGSDMITMSLIRKYIFYMPSHYKIIEKTTQMLAENEELDSDQEMKSSNKSPRKNGFITKENTEFTSGQIKMNDPKMMKEIGIKDNVSSSPVSKISLKPEQTLPKTIVSVVPKESTENNSKQMKDDQIIAKNSSFSLSVKNFSKQNDSK